MDSEEDTNKNCKWSTQSWEDTVWYQHEVMGFNYYMNNIFAGVVWGRFIYLDEHFSGNALYLNAIKNG